MATVGITYFRAYPVEESTAVIEVSDMVSEVKTSSASSQATTATATLGRNYVRVSASGGNIYVAFGTSPTAVTGTGFLILDGTSEVFHLLDDYKVAIID